MNILGDTYFMKEAFKEAQKAKEEGEVPVGAVIVSNNIIIARAHNQVETLNDPTAHAEMLAITSAANYLGSKYLENCTIYITLE
ncbi:MAG TPA: nucleoside deaminase, partial [Bacteroidetes bacterium]|nr:nucleoside deaminase [Bacteroidota bacterium]